MAEIASTHFRAVMESGPDLHILVGDFCGSVGRCTERVTGIGVEYMDMAEAEERDGFMEALPLRPKWTAHEGAVMIFEVTW